MRQEFVMYNPRMLASFALMAAVAACGGDNKAKTPEAAAPVPPNAVSFTAMDFSFDGPSEIPAGQTNVTLVSSGKELHHLTIVKLADGKTVDSLKAALANPGPPPAWVTFVGGPNAPAPGATSNAIVNFEPGNYVLLCFVDTPDHKPHFLKGMMRPLTVTPAAAANVELPALTNTVTLSEYAFTPDKDFVAGKNTIRVVNAGMQGHELELIRFEPGKTMEDLAKWSTTMQGPPPGLPLGGASPIQRGRDLLFDVDLVPGNYVLLCFLPDSTGKAMHYERGMVRQFEIK
jgi:hypothetical protein